MKPVAWLAVRRNLALAEFWVTPWCVTLLGVTQRTKQSQVNSPSLDSRYMLVALTRELGRERGYVVLESTLRLNDASSLFFGLL
jgi:hypothetical protein